MKILIPIDGSDCASHTLEWAAQTLDKQNNQYYLLHVIRILPEINTVEYDMLDAVSMLNKARRFMEEQGCQVIKAEYILGDPANQISDYATEMAIDQVLIGSHGRSGIAKLLLGSISEAVLERCVKPVFVYRNIERKPAASLHAIPSNTVL